MTRLFIYALIFAFVSAMGYAVVSRYNHAIERAQKLELDNATLMETNKEQLADNVWLRLEKARVDALLARREGVRQGEQQEREKLNAKLSELFGSNPEVRAWGDQRVPAALLDSVRLKPSDRLEDKNAAGAAAVKPAR